MEYEGKLYGRIGNKYFDTGTTSEDYDSLLFACKVALAGLNTGNIAGETALILSTAINQNVNEHKLIIKTKNMKKRILTKREIRNELFGILAMCDGFLEEGGMVGGDRKEEMIKYLPKQIASRVMQLQDLVEDCRLH